MAPVSPQAWSRGSEASSLDDAVLRLLPQTTRELAQLDQSILGLLKAEEMSTNLALPPPQELQPKDGRRSESSEKIFQSAEHDLMGGKLSLFFLIWI